MTTHLARRTLLLCLTVGTLLFNAQPAHAATRTLDWRDTANDAGGPYYSYYVSHLAPSQPASQPRLDILSTTMTSDGSTLVWTARYKALSNTGVGMQQATVGTGVWYAFRFAYGTGLFALQLRVDPMTGRHFRLFRYPWGSPSQDLSCVACTMTRDLANNTVSVHAPLRSLASGLRDSGAPGAGAGSVLRHVETCAGYTFGGPPPIGELGFFGDSDTSAPAGDDNFTL